jgi:hypothetical protein
VIWKKYPSSKKANGETSKTLARPSPTQVEFHRNLRRKTSNVQTPRKAFAAVKKPASKQILEQPAASFAGTPTDLDFEKALMFFHAYMYGPLQGKLRLYRARDVHAVGKALSSDWGRFSRLFS